MLVQTLVLEADLTNGFKPLHDAAILTMLWHTFSRAIDSFQDLTKVQSVVDDANQWAKSEGLAATASFCFPFGATMTEEESQRRTRKRFGPEEDIILAQQVNADTPLSCRYGEVMIAWGAVATALAAAPRFSMASVTAKPCYSRFKSLLEAHRRSNRESVRASGVSEDEDELTCVLDDVLTDYDDFLMDKAEAKKTKKHTAGDLESAGSVVRI